MKRIYNYMAGCAAILGMIVSQKCLCSGIDKQNVMQKKKYESLYNLAERWITIREEGKSLESILEERGIKTVVIYGLGKMGKHAVTQLKGSSISVVCAIDRVVRGYWQGVKVMPLQKHIPDADAVIVTAINDRDVIERNLKKYTDCTVLSLEELLYEG